MEKITPADLLDIAATANLAPSVHNTQPTRWHLDPDGAIRLSADQTRRLKVGDPTGRDLEVSVGAALEGTMIALSNRGLAGALEPGDSLRIVPRGGASPDPLAPEMSRRTTWRRGFAPAAIALSQSLTQWAAQHDDIGLVHEPAAMAVISTVNERTSLAFYRNAPYRNELLSWMRLSRSDPRFGVDGLSAPAMGMSGFEALGAGMVLRQPLFSVLDLIGVFGGLMSEERHTLGAMAILLFHRPINEHPVQTGRSLYRRQLELSALGLQTWPMSVLADDPEVAAELVKEHAISADRRLVTAWRVGPLPAEAQVRRERLPAAALIG